MLDFDDLRKSIEEGDSDQDGDDDFPINFDASGDDDDEAARARQREPFLGLTAGQRALLAVILFLNVFVIGVGLLIVTGRIVI